MAPGSHLVLSHASADGAPAVAEEHATLYRRTATPMTMRSHDEVLALFEGFTLVEPGLVLFPEWRPDDHEVATDVEGFTGYAGVGRRD